MTHPWTCVVSYHTDPETCGVARFSAELARRLGVPMRRLGVVGRHLGAPALYSLKWSELDEFPWHDPVQTGNLWPYVDVLWHDRAPVVGATGRHWYLPALGVPALVHPSRLSETALFTFGMAHKLELDHFADLRQRLGPVELWISTATHEGAGPSRVPDLMTVWGPTARNLGTLSDDALGLVWSRTSAVVAFFKDGLRANNTTVHAALNAGVPVVTNWGDETPDDLKAVTHDYRTLTAIPTERPQPSPYTWDRLMRHLCEGS